MVRVHERITHEVLGETVREMLPVPVPLLWLIFTHEEQGLVTVHEHGEDVEIDKLYVEPDAETELEAGERL